MKFRILINLAMLASLTVGFQSCGKIAQKNSRVVVKLPKQVAGHKIAPLSGGPRTQQSVGLLNDIWAPSFEPESTADLNCFGILIGGAEEELSSKRCEAFEGEELVLFGPNKMGALLGQTIGVEVSSGASRSIHVVGWKAENDAACFSLNPGESVDVRKLSHPYIIASKTVDLQAGDVTVDITASLTGAKALVNCDIFTANPQSLSSRVFSLGGAVSSSGQPLSQSDAPLKLENNGDIAEISAEGSFNFPSSVGDLVEYNVTVFQQPTGKSCSVNNGVGQVNGQNIGNVEVTCVDRFFSVGGVVVGLASQEDAGPKVLENSLTLSLNNGFSTVTVVVDGNFTFENQLSHKSQFVVSVASAPFGKSCTIADGEGQINGANVANVSVSCANNLFTVGGNLEGLIAGRSIVIGVIKNQIFFDSVGEVNASGSRADEVIELNQDGGFVFEQSFTTGDRYDIFVESTPPGQLCEVTNGSGTLVTANINNISVSCVPQNFAVEVNVSGLIGGRSLQLLLNDDEELTIQEDGATSFENLVPSGSEYFVEISEQPVGQICTFDSDAGGVIFDSAVGVSIICVPEQFTIGGNLTGLSAGNSIDLEITLGSESVITSFFNEESGLHTLFENGEFTLSEAINSGEEFSVNIVSSPEEQECSIENNTGTIVGENITNVEITCTGGQPQTNFSLGGQVTGVPEGANVVISLNANPEQEDPGEIFEIENGTFELGSFESGFNYNIAFVQLTIVSEAREGFSERCEVINGNGTIAESNVSNVLVQCGLVASGVASSGFANGGIKLLGSSASNTQLAVGSNNEVSVAFNNTSNDVQSCRLNTDGSFDEGFGVRLRFDFASQRVRDFE